MGAYPSTYGREGVVLGDDMEGFFKDQTQQNDLAEWTHNPDEGTLDLVFEYNGAHDVTFVQKPVHKLSEEENWIMVGEDWSEVSEIVYTIRVNEAAVGGIQPFIKTGLSWDWCGEWFDLVQDNDFHEYRLNIGLLDGTEGPYGSTIDISDVRSVGIEVNTGPRMEESEIAPVIAPGTISISIDSIVMK